MRSGSACCNSRQAHRGAAGWESYNDVVQGNYVALEDEAVSIRSFQSQIIPGLRQIEPYSRPVIGAITGEPDEIVARRAQARGLRRALLTRTDAPHLHAALDGTVLHRQIGGPAVMQAQLVELYKVARSDNVTIQHLSFDVGAHAGLEGRFVRCCPSRQAPAPPPARFRS
ncbi:DUF5753 domain-containing protein [Actinomadura sp. J1-007]|uniref:DUF5753 domain-containing protein n=1 Tax=Actinomadura sp. J1-007 TaxID=2661913 RepID=UPI0035CD1FC6